MRKVRSRGASKEAALYFDVVFPNDYIISSLGSIGVLEDKARDNCVPIEDMELLQKVCKSLIPGRKNGWEAVIDANILDIADFLVQGTAQDAYDSEFEYEVTNETFLRTARARFGIDLSYGGIRRDHSAILEKIQKRKSVVEREIGFSNTPEWISENFLEKAQSAVLNQDEPSFALSLHGLKLIDPSQLSWEKIIEFRKDSTARNALRRLRVFFEEELHGRDSECISDKLALMAEEQEQTARLWGFETVQKSLSVAFTHKSVLASGAAAMAATLAGAPLSAAAAGSLLVPMGSFGLEFTRALIDAAKARVRNPTRYLTMLKKLGAD